MVAFTGTGLVVAATMGLALLDGPAASAIEAHHIHYVVHVWQRDPLIALYAIATCGPLLRSTDQRLVWPGAVNVVAGLALVWIDQTAFVSLVPLGGRREAAIALYVRASRTLEHRSDLSAVDDGLSSADARLTSPAHASRTRGPSALHRRN
ncbi:MAG: DUF6629 family protein [Acidimicrobiales bacterium]